MDIAAKLRGYQHWWVVKEWWSQVIRTPFYAWFSQNWTSKCLQQAAVWGITGQVLRETGYKGEIDLESGPLSLPWASASTLGVLLLLGVVASCRGLAATCQDGALEVIDAMTHCLRRANFTIRLLPAWEIRVQNGQINMDEVLQKFTAGEQAEIKARLGLTFNGLVIRVAARRYRIQPSVFK